MLRHLGFSKLAYLAQKDWTKILRWPGYQVWRHEIDEKNKELKPEDAAQLSEETDPAPQVPEAAPMPPETEMASLRKLLDAAIEEENYEEAARIRDKIRELESS